MIVRTEISHESHDMNGDGAVGGGGGTSSRMR
jgi:hypothetical protein